MLHLFSLKSKNVFHDCRANVAYFEHFLSESLYILMVNTHTSINLHEFLNTHTSINLQKFLECATWIMN